MGYQVGRATTFYRSLSVALTYYDNERTCQRGFDCCSRGGTIRRGWRGAADEEKQSYGATANKEEDESEE